MTMKRFRDLQQSLPDRRAYFTNDIQEYLGCFCKIDTEKLSKLMVADIAKWQKELESSKRLRARHQKQVRSMLEK